MGKCQTTDVSKNVRKDAQDEIEDDNGKMLGGAGQGIASRMLGGARPGADQLLGGAIVGWMLTGCLLWMPIATLVESWVDLNRMAKVMLDLIALDARLLCFVLR